MDDESKILRLKDFGGSNVESSSSGPLKRTRGPSNGTQVPSCLVDGCRSDLSKCRDYHRRHKVCETHSKTAKVTICGQEQRFCQQCSRFHSLGEFDDEKRSCRKRLDGHNRRRRKPQPESLTINSGRFLSTYQGTRFSPFHSPQMFPSSAISSALAMASNSETNTSLYDARSQSFPRSLSHAYTSGKEISFLQSPPSCTTMSLSEASHMASNTGLNNCGSQKAFSEWLHRDNNIESNCALSLLSSSTQTGSSTSKAHHNNHHAVQPNSSSFSEAAHRAQCLTPGGLRYHGGLGMLGEQAVSSSALVTNDGSENAINFHCQDVFRIRPDGSSSSGDGSENAIKFHCQDVFRIRPDGSSSSGGPHHSSHYRGNRVPP